MSKVAESEVQISQAAGQRPDSRGTDSEEIESILDDLRSGRETNRANHLLGSQIADKSEDVSYRRVAGDVGENWELVPNPDVIRHEGLNLPYIRRVNSEDPAVTESITNLEFIDIHPWSMGEEIYSERENGYVVRTLDRYGHPVRNMAVFGEKGEAPSYDELEEYVDIYEDLVEITAGQVRASETEADKMVVNIGLNNTPDVPHIMASDLSGYPEEEIEDFKRTSSYILFDVEEDIEVEEYGISDPAGAAVLGAIHEQSKYGDDWCPEVLEVT